MKPDNTAWKVASTPAEVAKVASFPFKKVGQASWLNDAETPSFGQHYDTGPYNWVGLALFKKALEGGPPVRYCGWDGNLGVPAQGLLAAVEGSLGVRLVMVRENGNGNGSFTYSSDTAMVSLSFSEQGRFAQVFIATVDLEVVKKSEALFGHVIVPDNPEAGLVFSLVKNSMGGYSIRRLGAAGSPLERENYNPKVMDGFDHIVADLQTDSPCGRLVVMSGSPGTGKTYLVRSLLAQAKKAAFIVVPPQLTSELGSPEILPALTQAKSEFNGPIVLILEDADRVLVDRNQGDMSAISSMLNLGDGILGAVLDIRILATTNAEKLQMDPATQRRGRLCRYIDVAPLEPQYATKVLSRLVHQPRLTFKEPTSLANVYGQARDMGWVAPPLANARPQIRAEIL